MTGLEERLRDSLSAQVTSPPSLPGLPAEVVRRGRRARRRQRVAGGVAAVAVVLAGAGVATSLDRPEGELAVSGAATVPLALEDRVLVDGRTVPVEGVVRAQVASGLLVERDEEIVLVGDVGPVRVLVRVEPSSGVAVRAGGRSATVLLPGRVLAEVDLLTGSVEPVEPLAGVPADASPVILSGYAGDALYVTVGEGAAQRTVAYDDGRVLPYDPAVYAGVVATSPRGGVALLSLRERGRCGSEVVTPDGDSLWRVCREVSTAFSPDGAHLLLGSAVGDGLVVRDARTGEEVSRVEVPEYVRGSGWESAGAHLHVTVDEDATTTLLRRCSATTGRCTTAERFPGTGEVPLPVPRA